MLLKDVLARVAVPAGEKFSSTGASYYLVVECKDGYRAVFAWAELDSSGEKGNGRWVRQVTALRVRRGD